MNTSTKRRALRDLPGEARLDDQRIKRIVRKLRRLRRTTDVKTALAVGRALIDELFTREDQAAPIELVLRALPRHVSWTALVRRRDLGYSARQLRAYLLVALQHPHLPEPARDRLSLTHLSYLTRIPELAVRIALAEAAVAQPWTTRRLEQEVLHWRDAHLPVRPGRPVIPAHVRLVRAADRAITKLETEQEALTVLSDQDRHAITTRLESAATRLQGLVESLRGGAKLVDFRWVGLTA